VAFRQFLQDAAMKSGQCLVADPARVHMAKLCERLERFWRHYFATFYANSLFYAGLATLLTVMASATVAYGFARIQFAGVASGSPAC
jgi:ABC-type glycerol-3-phosphate transport system permease component